MTFDINALDYGLLTPQFILLALIFLTWTLDLMLPAGRKQPIAWVTVVGLIVAIVAAVQLWGVRSSFAGVLRIDQFSVFFTILFLLMAIGITLISAEYAERFLPQPGEFFGLVLSGTLGMMLMAAANELLTAYISLELLSFSSYVLVSYAKTNLKSNEAGMKYIILGAFSSALLLYGISLLYGALGTTYFPEIATRIARVPISPGIGVALALITAGLGFKVAAVPFHMWTPDVYEGAPTPVTAYLSVGSKAAGFTFLLRFMVGGLLPIQDQYQAVFAVLAVLTMTLGNLVAIQQRNVKRLLAYSSISQAGYVLVGMAAITRNPDVAEMATRGMMLHLAGYVFTNLAAFGAVIAAQNLNGGREMISDLAGLARRAPFVGLAMMAALFSLAGMPLFAGFVTKFYLFAAAARAGLLWLVLIAVVNSTISLYYYLLVLHELYVRTPPGFDVDGHLVAGAPAAAVAAPLMPAPAYATASVIAGRGAVGSGAVLGVERPAPVTVPGSGPAQPASGAAYLVQTDRRASAGAGALAHDGHAPGPAHSDGHGGHDAHAGHGAPDAGGDGAALPWWRGNITGDMPPEQSYPPYRIPWVTTAGLALFLAGILYLGLYPMPVIAALQAASSALFSR